MGFTGFTFTIYIFSQTMSTAGILQAYLPLGEKFAKSWYVIIISGMKIYIDNMPASLDPNLDLAERHGLEIHHTTLVSSQWSVVR